LSGSGTSARSLPVAIQILGLLGTLRKIFWTALIALCLSVSNSIVSVEPDLMVNIYALLSFWVRSGLDHSEDHSTNGPKVAYECFEPSGEIGAGYFFKIFSTPCI